jgi:protein SCO1/2
VKFNSPTVRSTTFLIVVCCISVVYYIYVLRPQQHFYNAHHVAIKGIYLIKPLDVPNFSLTDNHNNPFTEKQLYGHWTMVFFGFTRCAMVCPTTMSALTTMMKILETKLDKAQLPQVVFITVDPDRDTIEGLDRYVTSFNPNFIGARTSAEGTAELEKLFHVTSIKQDNNQNAENYSINHSADLLLINPEAKIQAYFAYPQQPEQLASNYQSITLLNQFPKSK